MIKAKFETGKEGMTFEDLKIEGTKHEIMINLIQMALAFADDFVDNVLEIALEGASEKEIVQAILTTKQAIGEGIHASLMVYAGRVLGRMKEIEGEDGVRKSFEEFKNSLPKEELEEIEGIDELFNTLLAGELND